MNGSPDDRTTVLVLRAGTEGLSMASYAQELRQRLPEARVVHARTPHEEATHVERADVVTGTTMSAELIERAERLRVFACTFSGTDHVPVDRLTHRGVAVTNASGIHAPGIAEQAIGSMLVFARGLQEGWRLKERRTWQHYKAGEFSGSTVTLIGLGAIGTAIAERLTGFNVETIGVRYSPEKGGPTDEIFGFNRAALHDALARTDYLVIACPLTPSTRGLIGAEELSTLPPTTVIVNTARGPILDTDALVAALQTGGIRGAVLDVTHPEPLPEEHPLWTFENCLITPHIGGHTPHHWPRLADIVAENVRRLEAGYDITRLRNLVNGPG